MTEIIPVNCGAIGLPITITLKDAQNIEFATGAQRTLACNCSRVGANVPITFVKDLNSGLQTSVCGRAAGVPGVIPCGFNTTGRINGETLPPAVVTNLPGIARR